HPGPPRRRGGVGARRPAPGQHGRARPVRSGPRGSPSTPPAPRRAAHWLVRCFEHVLILLTFSYCLIYALVEHVQIKIGVIAMDYRLLDYLVYIVVSAFLTIWVGDTLFRNGRPFLVSVFKEDGLADSVNRLLVIGFYLVNFGAAAILINTGGAPATVADMLKQTVTRVGVVLLVLGFMHFNNLLVLHIIRRPLRQKPLPPINYNPYQPAPGA